MADETEKITYEIVVDGSKAVASGKQAADAFKNVADSQKAASSSSKDYSASLDKLAPGLESTVKGAGGVLNSFKALVASPVGLVLAAVAGAFTVIKAAIEKSEPALDFIEDIMTKISSTAEALLNNLDTVGKFFGNLLIGDLGAAASAFGKLTDEIEKGNKAAQDYLDTMRDLEDQEFAFKIATADTENQIKALIKASQNRNLSFDESAAKVKEAIALERQMTEEKQRLTNLRTDADLNEIARKRGIFREEGEQFDAFLKRFTTQADLSGKEKDQIVALNDARKHAVSDSLTFQEKVQNQLDAISEKRKADADKAAQTLIANNELEATISQQRIERAQKEADELDKIALQVISNIEAREKAESDLADQIASNNQAYLDGETEESDKAYEEYKKRKKTKEDEVKIDFLLGQQKLANASTVLNQVAGLIDKNAAAYKVLAISQSLIDTYRAATAALAPPPIGAGPLFGPILAGTTIALGLANIAKIGGFFEGGYTGKGNPREESTRLGNRGYTYHKDEYVTPSRVLNSPEGSFLVNRLESLRMKGNVYSGIGGHFDGGFAAPFETSAIANQINNERQMSTLISAIIKSSNRVLVIEDVEALNQQRIDIREQATV